MKVEISVSKANRLLNTGTVILVTSTFEDKSNIITLAWQTPLGKNPPLVGICVSQSHYSHDIIKNSGEFVINIPTVDILDKVHYCGTVSGKDEDKFKGSGLTAVPAKEINSSLIDECVGHIECKIEKIYEIEHCSFFVGRALRVLVDNELFDDCWLVDKVKTLHHLGGDNYTIPGKLIIPMIA
jgi:flavin reductase (DIM6/NTAB) family NADH-FMN oxidoreductase RutF